MELTVEVKRITYRNNETKYTIFSGLTTISKVDRNGKNRKVRSKETFKGTFYSLFENDTIVVTGTWRENVAYGKEFLVETYVKTLPQDQKGIEKLLCRSVRGVGEKKVQAITESLGVSALSAIMKDKTVLNAIPSLSVKDREKIYEFVTENIAYEELLTFMRIHNLDYTVAMRIYKKYQADSVRKIMDNPYALALDETLSFHQVDKIALNLGCQPTSRDRLHAALLTYLKEDVVNNGNMFTYKEDILAHFNDYLQANSAIEDNCFTPKDIIKMLDTLYREDRLVYSHDESQQTVVYLSNNIYIENQIADLLAQIIKASPRIIYPKKEVEKALDWYERGSRVTLAKAQKRGIIEALSNKVSIITGGPGTGKTQTISAIIACMKYLSPLAEIHLCSPTGRASKRMAEMCGQSASTIHRLLRINEGDEASYESDFEGDLIIIDEASMIDAYLFYRTLKSLSTDMRILIIGDSNQLPSVGPGRILHDLIESRLITTTKLTEIFRQSKDSTIIQNAYRILQDEDANGMEFSNDKNGDCFFFETKSPLDTQDMILRIIDRLMKGKRLRIEDIQVLSPIKDGLLGTESLNQQIQARFGGTGDFVEYNNKQYFVKDKVMHIKNNYTLQVYNGEVGTIKCIPAASGKALTVEYPDKDVDYEFYELEELDLSFATTVHKSQGSEYPVVIIPVHNLLLHALSKTILYTACTRAKSIVIFVGSKEAMSKGMRKLRAGNRNTMLKAKIRSVAISNRYKIIRKHKPMSYAASSK
jgi:exodeoxyribonuclease V alpha subunit